MPQRMKPKRANDVDSDAPPTRKASALAILEAAEQLFAQYGHEAVSVRQVTLASGMANNSAVAYHFGDKAGLLRAIFEWRMPDLEALRAKLVEKARADNRLSDPKTLIGIMIQPFYELKDEHGRRTHARFMYHALRTQQGRAIGISIMDKSPLSDLGRTRLAAALAHIPAPLLDFRLRLGVLAFLDTVCELDNGGVTPGAVVDDETLIDELLDMAAAVCARPLSPKLRAGLAGRAPQKRKAEKRRSRK